MIIAFVCAAFAASLFADSEKSANAIIRLLNSRAAGSPRAYEAAAKIVRADADQGKPLQRFVLAILSRDKDAPSAARLSDGERDEFFRTSRDKILKLAERQNNPLAWYLLSMEKNDLGLLKKAADGGNVQALNAYGTIRLSGLSDNPQMKSNEFVRIQSEAYRCFKRASDQGDMNGFYNLGMCAMNGYGCKKNERFAFDCFCTAAEAGHPEAINNLGGFFRDGIVVTRNPELSTRWFCKSSELGNEFGILNYSLALLAGEGTKRDPRSAVKLLRVLSEKRNHAEAMNLYGMCLMKGDGVDKDEQAAFRWFEKSAALGFPMAMDNLASCYERGTSVEADAEKSMMWKMRARAAAGDRAAAEWLKGSGK